VAAFPSHVEQYIYVSDPVKEKMGSRMPNGANCPASGRMIMVQQKILIERDVIYVLKYVTYFED